MNSETTIRFYKKFYNKLPIIVLIFMISGCSVTKDYVSPEIDIPSDWRFSQEPSTDQPNEKKATTIPVEQATILADAAWWEGFGDDDLNNLIKIALNENKDLRIAVSNVEEFNWRLKSSKSFYYPQFGYGAAAYQDQRSLETAIPLHQQAERVNGNYEASFGFNWEVDIWGRIKRANEAARADLLSVEESKRAVVLTLVSTLIENYVELLSLDSQLDVTKKTLDSRNEWVKVFEIKSKGGQISDLELVQVKSAYEEIAVRVAPLERRIALQENLISVLLGRNPKKINRNAGFDTLTMPDVPTGLPSDLLKRRPDILQDEQRLIAANARVGVVSTQYYPSFSLTGLLGFASTELSNFLQGSSNLWAYGLGLSGPLYTGGRIKGEVQQAKAQYDQVLNLYLKTVQNAFKEVNDSLISLAKLKEQREIQKRHLSTLNEYLRFAQSRYDSGYTPYITVMDSQRQLYRAEISFIQTKSQVLKELVNLYKAMGGGWVTKAEDLIDDGDLDIEKTSVKVNKIKLDNGTPFNKQT